MEMALRPQSPSCYRSHQVLVVRPATGTRIVQSFPRTSRFSRRRIIRCTVASSGSPDHKSRSTVTPEIKVTAFGGYAPRLTIESSTKKREHHDSIDEAIGTYNRLLSTDATEWTSNRDVETVEGELPHNASSSLILGGVDVAVEVGVDLLEADIPENALINISLAEVDTLDAAEAKDDKFEADFSRIALSNIAVGELDAEDEVKGKEDIFVVDLSKIVPNSALADEAEAKEDTVEVELSRVVLSSVTLEEVDLMDEAGEMQETYGVDLSGNTSSSGTCGGVDEVGETHSKGEVTFEMDVLGNTSSSEKQGEVDVIDYANVDKDMLKMDSSYSSTALYMAMESAEEILAEGEKDQWPCPTILSTTMEDMTIKGTLESLKHVPMPLVRVQEQGMIIIGLDKEEQSIVDSHEEDHPVIDSRKQEQDVSDFIAFDKQKKSIILYEHDQSNVGSHRQDTSIIGVHEKTQSTVGYSKPNESSHHLCEQRQSIIGYSEPSIVGLHEEKQSIVLIPEQKQSIVGFHKQDLSIVGLCTESQTNQLGIVGSRGALFPREMEGKDEDYTSQMTDGDSLHAKVDVDNLLQKLREDINAAVLEMTTIKRVNDKEQWIVTGEDTSMVEAEMRVGEDKLLHLLSEEEGSWAEYELGIIEDEEQYEVEETFVSAEQIIHESPQIDMDPQALQSMLQELAEKNYSLGNKLFIFPEVVKAGSTIDLYLNRDLSALANEPDVLINGAFNGWRWRHFTERLQKSELGGIWWCCKLYIPKEAYRLDFVFFNGRTIYENNGNNDFMIQIESTMDEHLFEDFLVQEKQRELEKLASEEAERRRQTDEEWRREEERAAEEADRAKAKDEVEAKKSKLKNVLSLARTYVDNLWYIKPITSTGGATIRLYYNKNQGLLVHSTEIWMHGGYNNWIDGLSFAERLVQHDDEDGDWWYANVILPEGTYVLDWVFADGPPGNARNYDNNSRQDFHAMLLNTITEEEYWLDEEQRISERIQIERREREDAIKRKAERSAKMKAEMKEKTMRMFLVSQKHIVYTEPLEIHAGTTVDVLYNPSNTVLTRKTEVWFRGSFNRWMHPSGVLPPQKMLKSDDGLHLKATVNVPRDAYTMDFVFSESEEGGIYDNRNGLDYHIPVFGSTAKEPPMHVVHIAVEMAPIAKVGGLGDVVTSLSRAVQDLGHNVEVILPKHDCLNLSNVKNLHAYQSFSWGGTEIKVWRGLVEDLCVYFLEPQNGMFGVGCVYGRNDDRRFGFFCHSALEFLLQSGSSPNVIHCHDWSSAPIAWLYKENYAESTLANARVVFTIHNLEFGAHYIGKAMRYCDKATTVSNTYSREVSSHGAIAPHLGKFYGILNGIDPVIWDPYNDSFIPVHYTSENVVEGKNGAKKALQQKLGLQQTDVPIVGIVTRLTAQKGIHLIKHAIHRTLELNGQVVLLGSAPDHRIQGDFCNLANALHGVNYGRVRLCLTYDEPLSHLIYAGSDFVLVPSIFEPCGLTQLVAMRYGTIPIVRKTGGLYDTVFDVDHDKDRAHARGLEPNGFSFDGADANGVDYALNRAISAWFDAREWFHSLCKRVMEQDWSWNRPALDYIELYHSTSKL